ncbi:MAG: D-alanine--D-alanine ligase [Alphaproteobacteria bacterium ADurb.Bin438]|nr:MAG: D-alanine--D-alanine ligase [Alphaproteobacteria bacterium ADurb.Bin438]
MKLLIIYDKVSDSPDEIDTIEQVEFVKQNANCEVYEYQVSLDIMSFIKEVERIKPDLVFNLIENSNIHVIPSILDDMGIKYTGNSAKVLFLTTDKVLFKKLLPNKWTAGYVSQNEGKAVKGKKYIIKALKEDASIGIDENSVFVASNTKEVRERIKNRPYLSFAEEFIEGREVNIALLEKKGGGCEVLVPREVMFKNFHKNKPKILCYKSKWDEDSFEYKNTETVRNDFEAEPLLLKKLIKYSKYCWKRFDLKGYVRVDFRIDENNNPYILEINANPCINPHGSGFYKSFVEKGYKGKELIERIINVASK